MAIDRKLRLLARAAADEACEEGGADAEPRRDAFDGVIYLAAGPGGRPVPLLKILQSSFCERNCGYCAFRAGRDVPRALLAPAELAAEFGALRAAGKVRGLFLSSGEYSAGGTHPGRTAMDKMLATAEIVRRRGFDGYVHLKVLPGADDGQIERAAQLADRLSVNLEAPTAERLARIAPRKDYAGELLARVDRVARTVAERSARAVSWTTQYVVGAADETDLELLGTSERLYRERFLSRAYYSAFAPVPDTPLGERPAPPPMRGHRLYQADWLLRFYGFSLRELPFDADGALPQEIDPKTAWSAMNPDVFPVEINRVDPSMLLRVPGLGPATVKRIVEARARGAIRSPRDLARLGVRSPRRALPYLLFDGRSFAGRQLGLRGVA